MFTKLNYDFLFLLFFSESNECKIWITSKEIPGSGNNVRVRSLTLKLVQSKNGGCLIAFLNWGCYWLIYWTCMSSNKNCFRNNSHWRLLFVGSIQPPFFKWFSKGANVVRPSWVEYGGELRFEGISNRLCKLHRYKAKQRAPWTKSNKLQTKVIFGATFDQILSAIPNGLRKLPRLFWLRFHGGYGPILQRFHTCQFCRDFMTILQRLHSDFAVISWRFDFIAIL